MSEKRRTWTKWELDQLEQLAGKVSVEVIGQKLNRSNASVRNQAGKLGISVAMITADKHDIYLCRELFKEGLEVPVIAKKMEMRCAAVYRIVSDIR